MSALQRSFLEDSQTQTTKLLNSLYIVANYRLSIYVYQIISFSIIFIALETRTELNLIHDHEMGMHEMIYGGL